MTKERQDLSVAFSSPDPNLSEVTWQRSGPMAGGDWEFMIDDDADALIALMILVTYRMLVMVFVRWSCCCWWWWWWWWWWCWWYDDDDDGGDILMMMVMMMMMLMIWWWWWWWWWWWYIDDDGGGDDDDDVDGDVMMMMNFIMKF